MMLWVPHSEKQEQAIFSERKITLCGTGIQWGKTRVGAVRMKLKMHTYTSEDDAFVVCAPNYKILEQSTLPAFKALMGDLGTYNAQKAQFEMHGGGICYFRTSTDPDSIVGITNVRHIWGDEAGKYPLYFWENMQGRASFKDCQIDLTTSPYSLNWIFKEIIRPKLKDREARPDALWIHARSDENPYFPIEEYRRRKATMDPRRFNAMYGGQWERMAGLVYDCFDEQENQCESFALPHGTRFFGGIDWGHTEPFVFKIRGITPEGNHYGVSEFYKSGLTISDIVEVVKQKHKVFNLSAVYCGPDQPAHIKELCRAGITALPADNNVRLGIDKHYELLKTRRLKYFKGLNPYTLDEMDTYHYPDPDSLGPDDNVREQKPVQQHDHACLAGDTKIETENGAVRIDEIKAGDLVATPFGFKHVTASWQTGVKPVIEASFSDGTMVVLTRDHPVLLAFRGFSALDETSLGAIVATWKKTTQKKALFTTDTVTTGMADIGLQLAVALMAASDCTLLFGRLTMGLFRKAITCITRTMTAWITIFPILRLCPEARTSTFTQMRCRRRGAWSLEQEWTNLGTVLAHGTNPKREDPGTVSMPSAHYDEHMPNVFANNVRRHSCLMECVPNIARTIARALLDAKAAWIIFRLHAKYALSLSQKTNTQESEPVRLVALKHLPGAQKVYNLTVRDAGCYYANGILVSNCDAERYLSIMTFSTTTRLVPRVAEESGQKLDHWAETEKLKRKPRLGVQTEKWS